MNTDAFNFYAKHTNESIEKQLDLMAHRLRAMAESVEAAKAHASGATDARQQLIQNLDALRCATNDVHTNLMSNMRLDLATTLLVETAKLLATKVEG